ncbi:MAG TPA: hypothetical protein VI299_13045, partial [Polyangiales bacterium]
MPFPQGRGLRFLLGTMLCAASLAACADTASKSGSEPVENDPDSVTGDDDGNAQTSDDDSKPSQGKPHDAGTSKGNPTVDAGAKGNVKSPDGSTPPASPNESAGPCEGTQIGKRCVKREHLSFIEGTPQPWNDGTLVYDFDKSYDNLGALKKNKPKIKPNADLGEWYLLNGDYVRIGVSYASYAATGGSVADADRLPQRDGRNKDLTWTLTAVKGMDGTDLAAPNCLVCHATYFDGKLIPGLGRNKHWIASDASGFTLDVLGIGINSIFKGDLFAALGQDLGMLLRLFPDTQHSHLYDIFAALAMRHDPETLKWTGELKGNPESNMKGWVDFPAWWLSKKKNAVYWNGSGQGNLSNH